MDRRFTVKGNAQKDMLYRLWKGKNTMSLQRVTKKKVLSIYVLDLAKFDTKDHQLSSTQKSRN